MAYLTKKQYEERAFRERERSAILAAEKEEIAIENGMSEEQAELITSLCSLLSELHWSIDSLIRLAGCTESEIVQKIMRLNDEEFPEAGLDRFINSEYIIDIDCIEECEEAGEDSEGNLVPEDHDSEEYQEWYDATYYRAQDAWWEVITKIKDYLRRIDKKYTTNFASM